MRHRAPEGNTGTAVASRFGIPDPLFLGLLFVALAYLTARPAQSVIDPAVIGLLFLVALYRRPSMLTSISRWVVIPLLALSVLLAVTTLTYRDPKGINFLLQAVGLGGMGLVWGGSLQAREFELIRRGIVGLALVGTVYSIFETLLRVPPVWGPQVNMNTYGLPISMANPLLANEFDRAQFTMGHPLVFATLLLVAMFLVLRAPWPMKVRLALMGALAVGMVMCGSRSVLPVLVVLFVAAFVLDRARVTLTAALVGLSTLVVAGALVAVSPLWHQFVASGSFTHRVGAIDAAHHLLTRQDALNLLFGNGVRSEPRLLSEGLLQSDRFPAVDNQFVQMLALGGLLGLALLLVALGVAVWRSPRPVRLALIAVVAMFLAYEVLFWSFGVFVLTFLVGLSAKSASAPSISSLEASERKLGPDGRDESEADRSRVESRAGH